jgi:hypothetical protein
VVYTAGRVSGASGVVLESLKTDNRVVCASGQIQKRIITLDGIVVG